MSLEHPFDGGPAPRARPCGPQPAELLGKQPQFVANVRIVAAHRVEGATPDRLIGAAEQLGVGRILDRFIASVDTGAAAPLVSLRALEPDVLEPPADHPDIRFALEAPHHTFEHVGAASQSSMLTTNSPSACS